MTLTNMNRAVSIIAVVAVAAASCSGGESTTETSTSPATTVTATTKASPTTTTTVENVAETTGAETEPEVSWVEYDACVQAHWHEEGVDPPPGTFSVLRPLGGIDDEAAALFRKKCAPWRPVPYEKPPFTGSGLDQ